MELWHFEAKSVTAMPKTIKKPGKTSRAVTIISLKLSQLPSRQKFVYILENHYIYFVISKRL